MTPVFECPNGMPPAECLHLPNLPYRAQKFFSSLIKRQQTTTQGDSFQTQKKTSDHSPAKGMTPNLDTKQALARGCSADRAKIRSRAR
jgi:hypothetical protein